MLNSSYKQAFLPCPDFRGKAFSFVPLTMILTMGLSL